MRFSDDFSSQRKRFCFIGRCKKWRLWFIIEISYNYIDNILIYRIFKGIAHRIGVQWRGNVANTIGCCLSLRLHCCLENELRFMISHICSNLLHNHVLRINESLLVCKLNWCFDWHDLLICTTNIIWMKWSKGIEIRMNIEHKHKKTIQKIFHSPNYSIIIY